MRHFIRLIETAEYPVLYHGTHEKWRDEIMTHGLLNSMDVSHREFGPGVYLTNIVDVARNYGPLVLAIDVSKLDTHALAADDYELTEYFDGVWGDGTEGNYSPEEFRPEGIFEASWRDSLRICHQCKYLGNIPPEAISVLDDGTLDRTA